MSGFVDSAIQANTQQFNYAINAFNNAARNSTTFNQFAEQPSLVGANVNQFMTHRYGASSSLSALHESNDEVEEEKLHEN